MPRHNEKLVELIGMMCENVFNAFDCQLKRYIIAEAQVDDSRMQMSLSKDEFTEVTIVGDEDASV